MYKVNHEILLEMFYKMPETKKKILRKALERNELLTSSYVLEDCTMRVYKEGWSVRLLGARTSFYMFAMDNDGEFVFMRKPLEDKLNFLYLDNFKLSESDFALIKQ